MSSSEEQIVEATGTALGELVGLADRYHFGCADRANAEYRALLDIAEAAALAAEREDGSPLCDCAMCAANLRDALARLDAIRASPPASVPSPPEPALRECPDCGGHGWIMEEGPKQVGCERCDTRGYVQSSPGQAG